MLLGIFCGTFMTGLPENTGDAAWFGMRKGSTFDGGVVKPLKGDGANPALADLGGPAKP